jgi:hypothetical protein
VAGYGPDEAPAVNGLAHAAVLVAGAQAPATARLWLRHARAGVPACVLAPDAALVGALAREGVDARSVLVCGADDAPAALASWLVAALPGQADALAACFACCRRARALAAVSEAARNNALVGALWFLGEADLPVMLANELALMLKLADVCEVPKGPARVAEGALVAASSLVLRAAARAAHARTRLPGALVDPVVAAVGTYAVGRALLARYEGFSPLVPPRREALVLSVEKVDDAPGAPTKGAS